MRTSSLDELLWPPTRLNHAVLELLQRSGLAKNAADLAAREVSGSSDCGELIEWLAARAGCEAEALHTTIGALEEDLAIAFPSILQLEAGLAVIVRVAKGKAELLDPAGCRKRVSLAHLCSAIREPMEREQRSHIEEVLSRAHISGPRRAKAERALLNEQNSGKRFERCWILRGMPGERLGRMLRKTGAVQNGGLLFLAHTLEYLLWLASWALLGKLSFEGRLDRGWLLAWVLLLASLIPCHLLTTWCQGLFAIGLGGNLKRRLLYGAMRLSPDEMRHCGIGGFIGQAIEAEAVESLALSGGIAGVLAIVELGMASVVLGKYALLLLLFAILAIALGWYFFRHYERWTGNRMRLTQDLVESMAGHRTRLAQLPREHWHDQEDQDLQAYLGLSRQVDHSGARLVALLPRAWLLAGIVTIAPSIVAGKALLTETAIALGGVLLGYTAFRRLTGSFADVAAALIACKRIAPLYRAASRKETVGDSIALAHGGESGQKLLETERLTFRYRPRGAPALQGVNLVIRRGDKILLEGASGGGKTTFASLVSGIREPESGLLLLNGLDRHSTGERRWRQRIASAPQFHENHILTETLAFNLLMGRRWPPTPPDLEEAEAICRELGLGPLLDAMPSGLLQMVGEGGWQLSHGEQSRIFIARALLQNAELVILDESFAALDPENLRRAMECTLQRAKTLMVIAHP